MATVRSLATSPPSPRVRFLIGSLARTTSTVILTGLVLLLIARRLAGAFSEALPVDAYALLGVLFAVAAVLIRRSLANTRLKLPDVLVQCAGTFVAAAGGLAVSLSTTPALGLLAIWLPIALEEGWSWRQWFTGSPQVISPFIGENAFSQSDATNESEVIALDSALSELAFADTSVIQHLVRRNAADGSESISGCLRARFLPGQRTVDLHIPFCPPLAKLPQCAAEMIDGPPARVKVAQVFPQGARLEVRLDEAATEPQQVVVEFSTG